MASTAGGWFDSTGFMPHGHCYLWTPAILGMHVVSDILIGLAYLVIPIGLYQLHRRRPDLDFNWLFVSFSLFIVTCGVTHWLSAWDIWHAEYWLEGFVKVLTAALSIPTAILLWRALPQLIAPPSHAALTRAHDEKGVLLKEIHHRVKNNLSVISSLFYLESTQTEDEAARALLQQSQDRVRSMALVHESLYRSESLAEVDLAEYATTLCEQLLSTYRRADTDVRLTTDLEPVRMNIELAIPCGLILNELVTNALKHAFRPGESGEIHLSLHRTEAGGCVLTVRDRGAMPRPASERGPPPKDSLGLRIVKLMAQQVDAVFKLDLSPTGAEASLTWRVLAQPQRH
jgi:two-component sensor histidine kinase